MLHGVKQKFDIWICRQRLQQHKLALLVVGEETGEEPLRWRLLSQPLGEDLAPDVLLRQRLRGHRARLALIRSFCHAAQGLRRGFFLPLRAAEGERGKCNPPPTAQALPLPGRTRASPAAVAGRGQGRSVAGVCNPGH